MFQCKIARMFWQLLKCYSSVVVIVVIIGMHEAKIWRRLMSNDSFALAFCQFCYWNKKKKKWKIRNEARRKHKINSIEIQLNGICIYSKILLFHMLHHRWSVHLSIGITQRIDHHMSLYFCCYYSCWLFFFSSSSLLFIINIDVVVYLSSRTRLVRVHDLTSRFWLKSHLSTLLRFVVIHTWCAVLDVVWSRSAHSLVHTIQKCANVKSATKAYQTIATTTSRERELYQQQQ